MAETVELTELEPVATRQSRLTYPNFDASRLSTVPHTSDVESTSYADSQTSFIPALPPVDGGKQAWLFLAGATMMETVVWGLPFSAGLLHQYWTSTLFKGEGDSTVTLAVALQTGLMYMSAGAFGPLFAAYPRYTRHIQVVGLVIAAIALIGSAFVTQPWHLIVTIGCLYPFATAAYTPCAILLFEWFSARRGFASGIMYAGTGVGGTVFPFIMSALLNNFGYKPAMISLGVGFLLIGLVSLLPVKRRIPLAKLNDAGQIAPRRQIDWAFATRKTMVFGLITIMVTSLGNFVPSVWLPTYAADLDLSPGGTGLIALMNAASVPGNTLLGYLSDRWPLHHVITLSCLGSASACLFLWGFGTSSGPIVAFVLVFGMLGLSLAGLWSKMISTICGQSDARTEDTRPEAQATTR